MIVSESGLVFAISVWVITHIKGVASINAFCLQDAQRLEQAFWFWFSGIANDNLDVNSRASKNFLNDAIQNILRSIANNTKRNFTFANITKDLGCSW